MEYHHVKSNELLKVYGIGIVVFNKEDRLVVFGGENDYAIILVSVYSVNSKSQSSFKVPWYVYCHNQQ